MTESTDALAPKAAFLGVCERIALVREGPPQLWRHNVIGLRQTVVNFFYPARLNGLHLLVACYEPQRLTHVALRLVAEDGAEIFKLEIDIQTRPQSHNLQSVVEERAWRVLSPNGPTWLLFDRSLDIAVIPRPGPVAVMFKESRESDEVRIGTLNCGLAEPAALTPERVAAIRSDPRAAKQVRTVLGCTKCPSKLSIVAAIERSRKQLDGGAIWYEDAPKTWTCSCGQSVLDLSTIGNLHALLGTRIPEGNKESPITFVQMYERGALADVCAAFGALLDDDCPEEAVQEFLERHPVLLHTFNPIKIRPKAPILTKHKTDFVVLDSRGILVLVELEKPGIRLLRKDGNIAQHLQHAFGQARSWLRTANQHWGAALECLGFKLDEVAGARAVVIAGRDQPYAAEDLMRLKGSDHGQVDFYTYDDILESTVGIARELG